MTLPEVIRSQLDRPVKACPECGQLAGRQCWHDGEVYSVQMPASKAIELLQDKLSGLHDEIDETKSQIASLEQITVKHFGGTVTLTREQL